VPLRRSGNDLPSRVADHLFWLGRHVERAEGTARLLRAVAARMASEANHESTLEAALLLGATASPPEVRPAWLEPERRDTPWEIAAEIQALVFDESRPGSVRSSVASLWRMASVVRDRISIDSWKILARVRRDCYGARGASADVLSLLDTLILDLSAFAGLGMESMTRGPGWRFLDMGRRIERSQAAIQLLGGTLVAAAPGPRPDPQRLGEVLLEIADSSMTYRNRYPGAIETEPLIDLLVIDETNPRSIAFQVAALADHVEHLPREGSSPVLAAEQRAVLSAVGLLRLADVSALAAVNVAGGRGNLGGMLTTLDAAVRTCAESVTHHYLVHATPRRRLGEGPEMSDARA
jgi:uncharacterized alpha-E superfamily protein